jgi:hypothetical protein
VLGEWMQIFGYSPGPAMGLRSVAGELGDLIDKPVVAVAAHGPDDHIGGHSSSYSTSRPKSMPSLRPWFRRGRPASPSCHPASTRPPSTSTWHSAPSNAAHSFHRG